MMNKIKTSMLLILTVLLLSSCASISKVDEDKVKDVTNKITEAIINTVGKEKAERQELHTINAKGIETLKINSSVGDISIYTHDSTDAVINLNIVSHSSSKEKSKQVVEEFTYSVKEIMKSINIDTTIDKGINDTNISTDLSINIPNTIENIIISLNVGDIYIKNINGKYKIENNVGDIKIENSKASYDIKTNVGDIKLSDTGAIKNSEFNTNTGDIEISFNDITNADKIKAATDVGDINISVPDDSSYEAVMNEFMQKEKIESNKDKQTKIEIKTGVGNIDFK